MNTEYIDLLIQKAIDKTLSQEEMVDLLEAKQGWLNTDQWKLLPNDLLEVNDEEYYNRVTYSHKVKDNRTIQLTHYVDGTFSEEDVTDEM